MSVNSGGNNNGPAATPMGTTLQDAGVSRPSVGQQQAAPTQARPAGIRGSINGLRPRPVSRFGHSEVSTRFQKAFEQLFDENVKAAGADAAYRDMFRFHVLDHTTFNLPLSLLCAVMTIADAKGAKYAGVFTYVIAASNARLANRFINWGQNQSTEVDVVPGDVINPQTWAIVEAHLQGLYGSDVKFYNAGGADLPHDMVPPAPAVNGGVPEVSEDVRLALYHGTQALYTVLEPISGSEEPLSVKQFAGYTIQGAVNVAPPPAFTLGNQPVRNDLSVELNYVTRTQGLHGATQDVTNGLTRVGGYVDLEYVGQPQMQPMNPFYPQQPQQQTAPLAPRYVITELDTRTDAVALEDILLGLYSAGMLTQNWTWARQFEPHGKVKKGELDFRDIGALGYLVNFGDPNSPKREKVDTRTLSQTDLYKMIGFAIRDTLAISLDIAETGTLSWIHQYFIASAAGVQSATQAIVKAANNLTNGVFGQLWDNSPIVRDDNNRLHLGYYTGRDNERRDLREVDRLAILNIYGDRDMEMVWAWDRSWNDLNIRPEVRMETRAKVYKNGLSGVEITGYARRVTFTTNFIVTLTKALIQAGLVVQQTNMTMIPQTGQHRPLYNMDNVALSGQAFAGAFTMAGGNGYGGFRGGNSAFLGRFQ